MPFLSLLIVVVVVGGGVVVVVVGVGVVGGVVGVVVGGGCLLCGFTLLFPRGLEEIFSSDLFGDKEIFLLTFFKH